MSMINNLIVGEKHYYVGEVIRDGKVIAKTAPSCNLIVDGGWAVVRASTSTILFMAPCVGTGSTPPAVTDTSLDSFLYGTANDATRPLLGTLTVSNSGDAAGTVPRYSIASQSFTWALGAVVGNVTEVGMYVGTADNVTPPGTLTLYSRALFVDGGGAPVTLTVTADDYLRVTVYRERHTQQANITGTFDYDLEGVVTSVGYEAQPQGMIMATSSGSSDSSSNSWHICHASAIVQRMGASPLATCGLQAMGWGNGPIGDFFVSAVAPVGFPLIWDAFSQFTATGSSTFPTGVVAPFPTSLLGDVVTVEGVYSPTSGNTTQIQAFRVSCGYACWSIKFASPLQKTDVQSIRFNYSVTFERNIP